MWWTLKCDKICKNVKSAKKIFIKSKNENEFVATIINIVTNKLILC